MRLATENRPHRGELSHRAGAAIAAALCGAALVGLGASLAWSYWPALAGMAERWRNDPQYSHGYLVPVFAAALLWVRWDARIAGEFRPSWWGLAVLAAAGGMRLVGAYFYLDWLDAASLVPALAGVALLAGGGRAARWSWPAVAYLLFMVPLPHRVQTALPGPLQRLATGVSTYALETLGVPAHAEGNVIVLSEVRLGVEEACSGLTMLMTFFALATAAALVVRRPALDRAVLVASAIPIALFANVTRITATGVLHETAGPEVANAVFHDWAGWLMMPLALGLMGLLLAALDRLLVAPAARELPVPVFGRPGLRRPAARMTA
jgi:exosortase